MHQTTSDGRWRAPAGQFAAKIRAAELPGVLAKTLFVDIGTRAVAIEDGAILGELAGGAHVLETLEERWSGEPRRQTSVIVMRSEPIAVELAARDYSARDGEVRSVGLKASVQVADAVAFVEALFGAHDELGLDALRALLAPVLGERLRAVVGTLDARAMRAADGAACIAAAFAEDDAALRRRGFRLAEEVTVTIRPAAMAAAAVEPGTGRPNAPSPALRGELPGARADSILDPASALSLRQAARQPDGPPRRLGRRTLCEKPATVGPRDWCANAGQPPQDRATATDGIASEAIAVAPSNDTSSDPEQHATAARESLANSVGMRFAFIAPGRFVMGSPHDEPDRRGNEEPHTVEITRAFALSVFPVMQDAYLRVMGTDPSCFVETSGAHGRLPVERVSWDDASAFCRRLSELPQEKAAGRRYRLPTEAEWEFACRAGTTSVYAFGDALTPALANFDGRTTQRTPLPAATASIGNTAFICNTAFIGSTTPVGSYPPNAWGLYDMHGNVWEWCHDYYAADDHQTSNTDPAGPEYGFARVLRGGSWRSRAEECRSAARHSAVPTHRHDACGFRVACEQGAIP